MTTVPTSNPTNSGPCVGNVPAVTGLFLCRETASRGQQRNQEQEPSDQHRQPEGQVVPGSIRVDASEGAAIVSGAAHIRIEDFAEAMRATVIDVRDRRARRIPVALGRKLNDRTDSR